MGQTRADMVLTKAAQDAGFGLTTFADGFAAPIGMAFPAGGGVMVTNYPAGQIVLFATDTDGQHYSGGTKVNGYSSPAGLTSSGGKIYLAEQGNGRVVQLNDNGTLNHLVTTMAGATGLTTNPTNGHLFLSTTTASGHVFDIDPTTGATIDWTATHGGSGAGADGLTFSADGKTLYAAIFGQSIQAYDLATGTKTFSAAVPGSDGTALGTGNLDGFIFANTNFGQLIEINLKTGVQTVIGTGGSRGDFVEVDPSNGTLLLTQSDRVLRLTAPPGGGFGTAPAPPAFVLAGVGALCLGGFALRRRKTSAG
jgi:DNA-binding beta-propeller fold protein YncE